MMSRLLIPLSVAFAFTFAADAFAKERTPMFTDKGTTLAKDPYLNGSALTEGRLEGFRKLYVPETFLDGLKPAKVPGSELPAVGDLAIANPTSAWADVKVNGEIIGRLGPFREGVLHDVASGVYTLEFSLPNGQVFTSEAATALPTAPVGEG